MRMIENKRICMSSFLQAYAYNINTAKQHSTLRVILLAKQYFLLAYTLYPIPYTLISSAHFSQGNSTQGIQQIKPLPKVHREEANQSELQDSP